MFSDNNLEKTFQSLSSETMLYLGGYQILNLTGWRWEQPFLEFNWKCCTLFFAWPDQGPEMECRQACSFQIQYLSKSTKVTTNTDTVLLCNGMLWACMKTVLFFSLVNFRAMLDFSLPDPTWTEPNLLLHLTFVLNCDLIKMRLQYLS